VNETEEYDRRNDNAIEEKKKKIPEQSVVRETYLFSETSSAALDLPFAMVGQLIGFFVGSVWLEEGVSERFSSS